MRQFTVVFPICKKNDEVLILLGEQPVGKPLAGYLNGYGGKVEPGESVLSAAKRELFEELGVVTENLVCIGNVTAGEKEITFFLTQVPDQIFKDGDEMIHNTWHNLSENAFISKMLPGDNILIEHLRLVVPRFFKNEEISPFSIRKEGIEIQKATQELDNKLLK